MFKWQNYGVIHISKVTALMAAHEPTLHLLCGKIAAGKSTLAQELAADPQTVLISEDAWLAALFAEQMTSGADYLRCSTKLQQAMTPHVKALLAAGVSVVLDFPANTVEQRAWMRAMVAETAAAHQLHVLDLPDEVCLARLHARNASGTHPFAVTDAQFHRFSKHFAPPGPEEGFHMVVHRAAD